MHNKPYKVDATRICRVLPDFKYIPLEASVKAAANSVVAMGLAAMKPSLSCCKAPAVREFGPVELPVEVEICKGAANASKVRHELVAE